jgi:hypothetical protein
MDRSTIRVTECFAIDRSPDARFQPRVTQDGYLVAMPRVGRIGIQLYRGSELGRPEMDVVRVWRPEDQVMHKDAARTVAHRPVTSDHPSEPVTADNWRKYAIGQTGDEIMRDGEFIRVPMTLMDAKTIQEYNDGKKELSLGYTSQLEWRSGTNPQGEQYDAMQTSIRINHLALVDAARGGPKLAIGDCVTLNDAVIPQAKDMIMKSKVVRDGVVDPNASTRLCLGVGDKYPFAKDGKVYRSALESIKAEAGTNQHDAIVVAADELLQLIDAKRRKSNMTTEERTTNLVVDGVALNMPEIAASVVGRTIKRLEDSVADLTTKLKNVNDEFAKKGEEEEGEKAKAKKKMEEDAATIATLQQQLKDAAITPEKLDQMVADRGVVIGKAKAVLGDKLVVTGKTEADIRRQVVDAKLGDSAKGWSDDAVAASFATLTANASGNTITAADAAARTFSGQPVNVGDRMKPINDYNQRLENRWKGPQAAQ